MFMSSLLTKFLVQHHLSRVSPIQPRDFRLMHVVEDPSDDELDDGETVESTGEGVVAGRSMPPPSYAELSSFFGPLEHFAQS